MFVSVLGVRSAQYSVRCVVCVHCTVREHVQIFCNCSLNIFESILRWPGLERFPVECGGAQQHSLEEGTCSTKTASHVNFRPVDMLAFWLYLPAENSNVAYTQSARIQCCTLDSFLLLALVSFGEMCVIASVACVPVGTRKWFAACFVAITCMRRGHDRERERNRLCFACYYLSYGMAHKMERTNASRHTHTHTEWLRASKNAERKYRKGRKKM